jgi:hypothetical protein
MSLSDYRHEVKVSRGIRLENHLFNAASMRLAFSLLSAYVISAPLGHGETRITAVMVTVFRKQVWIFGIKKPDKQVRAGNITRFITIY